MNQKTRLMCLLCSPAMLGAMAHAQPLEEVPGSELAPAFERPSPGLSGPPAGASGQQELRMLIDTHGRVAGDDQGVPVWRLNPQQRAELREQLRAQSRHLAPARRASATRP